MKIEGVSQETMLEIGFMGLMLCLAAGAAMLFGGHVFGNVNQRNGKNTPPPIAGKISPSQHRHIASNAAR